MKLKGRTCTACDSDNYSITYKFGLFLQGAKCKKCKKRYNIKGALPLMSTKYVDVMFKIVLILAMIFFASIGFLFGSAYMFVLILICNYLIYPFMFKVGMLVIDKEGKK